MLNRLHIRNFTVFAEADFEFGPGLNVIVGTNGTGKSHVLKLGYATLYSLRESRERVSKVLDRTSQPEDREKGFLPDKLLAIFQPDPFSIKGLIRRNVPGPGSEALQENKAAVSTLTASVAYPGEQGSSSIHLDFASGRAKQNLQPNTEYERVRVTAPVFIPAKEVLTLGWLRPLYERREVPIDESYPDVLRLLFGPPLRLPEPTQIVERLQNLIGGKVEEEGGHFYLSAPEQPRMEMNLVAEGMRKFATLYKLLANGTLTPETTLFWDEPEANLNPALLKQMAAILAEMARAGFQIILATHSLFLLKELHILSRQDDTKVHYFGLSSAAPGEAVTVAAADTLTDLPNLVALEVEMAQSDAFLNVLNQEDANS